jgi:SAM-dependent methyltransferase
LTGTPPPNQHERIACPLCASDQADTLFIARDRLVGMPGEFPVVRCRACRFVYLNPRPAPEALPAFYPSEYYPLSAGRETPEALAVARGLLDRVEEIDPGGNLTVLDAGCGTGLFLKLARDRGHIVRGVELSDSAAEYGRKIYGLAIESGTLESARLPEDTFDVITMWHVLEHLPDPVSALRIVQRTLKPGGVLLFGVPNIGSLEARFFGRRWFSLDAPRHLGHFDPDSARTVVEVAGLKLDRIVHSEGTAGMVYSLMGDLTGISLKFRGREIPDGAYHRIAGILRWVVWPLCVFAARAGRGGAIEVYARKPPV